MMERALNTKFWKYGRIIVLLMSIYRRKYLLYYFKIKGEILVYGRFKTTRKRLYLWVVLEIFFEQCIKIKLTI